MLSGPCIIQIVALTDMSLAVSISCYIGFQIGHGSVLIPGQLSEMEKITRLVVYSTLLFLFMAVQLYMALRLLRTTRWIFKDPSQSLRDIATWLEWSFVYLLLITIHGATALLLMTGGPRKSIIMLLSVIQVVFRICGIFIVAKHHYILPPQRETIKA